MEGQKAVVLFTDGKTLEGVTADPPYPQANGFWLRQKDGKERIFVPFFNVMTVTVGNDNTE